jgi:hypothetical protein
MDRLRMANAVLLRKLLLAVLLMFGLPGCWCRCTGCCAR